MPLDSIRRLRYEPKEGEEELARVRANVVIQKSSESAEVDKEALAIIPEQGKIETIPSRAEMVEGEIEGKTSRATEDISKDELGIVDITGSPQFSDAMIREASMLEGRSYKGIQESIDIHGFLEGLESSTSEDITEFSGLLVDELMAEEEKFKKNMDILASKKEAVQAQLELAEAQLRAAKKNALVQIERVKELQHQLDLATSDTANLANELEVARSEVAVAISEVAIARFEVTGANKRVDAKVAQFKIDVKVNQAKAKSMVEHAK
ncbi:filament-like plant protein 1 [Nicotiana tomentosiformis]|uniref:filament-like plant protein 1 n=1 Tax=Nicotiana tomentosiformis TaxID=4098 RepID=UPI00388CBDCA